MAEEEKAKTPHRWTLRRPPPIHTGFTTTVSGTAVRTVDGNVVQVVNPRTPILNTTKVARRKASNSESRVKAKSGVVQRIQQEHEKSTSRLEEVVRAAATSLLSSHSLKMDSLLPGQVPQAPSFKPSKSKNARVGPWEEPCDYEEVINPRSPVLQVRRWVDKVPGVVDPGADFPQSEQ